jgi:uncharacterized protein (TIGR03067 family)
MPAAALVMVMALLPADASAPVDGPPLPSAVKVEDAGELQGEWEVLSVFVGKRDESGAVKRDRWRFVGVSAVVVGATQGPRGQSNLHVNPATDPPMIEREMLDGRIFLGIYRRTSDELLWADGGLKGNEPRPSSFEPAPGVFVWTLRRVKK